MSDAHGVARDQLRAFIERIERLEEEKKTIADDIKDVYGEAKGFGYDTVILKRVIALRKKDDQERMEQEMILSTYLAALGMIPDFEADREAASTAPRQNRSTAQPLQSPRRAADIISERPAEPSRPALPAVSGGEPSEPSFDDGGAKTDATAIAPGRPDENLSRSGCNNTKSERATNSIPPSDDDAFAAVKGKARLANVADVEPSLSAPIAPASQGEAEAPSAERVNPEGGSADANTGGDHVDAQPPHLEQAETAVSAVSATPGTTDHCHTCKRAMAERTAT